jgi:glycosyltransferase involved in cell wall biosynthesis
VRQFLAPPPEASVTRRPAPTFSVIIAAYQVAHLVGEAVGSAIAQSLPAHEVIVCDDGSSDDIEGALTPYRDRIVFLRKENGGEASAKNVAARAASGDFIAILDADDVFMPGRLEAFAELAATRPDLDILTTDAQLELDGQVVRRCYTDGFQFVVYDQRSGILKRNFILGLAAVRRDRLLAAGGFDESLRWTTDWDCWIRLILEGSRAGLVDEPLARYRLHPGSLSSQRARLLEGRVRTLEKAARHPGLEHGERQVVADSLAVNRRALDLAESREALLERRPDARRRALAVAVGPGFGVRTRLKALASAIAPSVARGRLARRDRITTAGLFVPPDQG